MPPTGTAPAVIEVLQPNPVFVVQLRALAAVEHVPTARAVGTAVPLVAFPRTVFVVCVASFASVTALLRSPAVGKPVALVSTPALGVPRFGVTSAGLALKKVFSCAAVAPTIGVPTPHPWQVLRMSVAPTAAAGPS
jgi:hypothetical protein